MKNGMIPIITRECSIEMNDHIILIEEGSIESILKTVELACEISVEDSELKSLKIKEFANSYYSEESFVSGLKSELEKIKIM
jgi:hypothetical protein